MNSGTKKKNTSYLVINKCVTLFDPVGFHGEKRIVIDSDTRRIYSEKAYAESPRI